MKIIKIWNENFERGISIFQIFLAIMMIIGAFMNNRFLVIFSLINFLFAYFEPTKLRFSIKTK